MLAGAGYRQTVRSASRAACSPTSCPTAGSSSSTAISAATSIRNMLVDVEVLDVSDDEARALLLSIDPLASLAETQEELHRRCLELTPTPSLELEVAWREALDRAATPPEPPPAVKWPERFVVMIECRDEKQQVELLTRFHKEGLECKAIVT